MAPRSTAALLCLALLLIAPTAVTQGEGIIIDVATQPGEAARDDARPGQSFILWANVTVPDRENTSWRAGLQASMDGQAVGDPVQLRADNGTVELPLQVSLPLVQEATTVALNWTVTVESINTSASASEGNQSAENQTSQDQQTDATWEEARVETGSFTFQVAPPPPPPMGPPWGVIAAVVAVLLVGAAVVLYMRRPRQYQHEAGHRSQTLRELKEEGKGAAGAGQTQASQEPGIHPQVKILEARKADVRRMIELARERHERGDLTEHQFEMIRKKKETELQEIEAEIDEHRSGDAR